MTSAAEQLKTLLNGPILAGVGATVDAGLTRDQYHVLPWDVSTFVKVKLREEDGGIRIRGLSKNSWMIIQLDSVLQTAIYNLDHIYKWDDKVANHPNLDSEFLDTFKKDLISILALSMAHSYYFKECRRATSQESKSIENIEINDSIKEDIFNMDKMNRAATFVLARMHTKYQTNHAIGGNPMQASMASSVRAFYQVSPGASRAQAAQDKLKFIADGLYWALHPLNEALLIPHVINGTGITEAQVHAHGPMPITVAIEEYFAIRSKTPPASSHHFYVAAACIRALDPMGILPYLPEPSRVRDIQSGLFMIKTHGAKLHPAARFWGLERVTCNQKLVEPICADLGYAVRKLMPASSLSASPILVKEDGLNASWKAFIDALRAVIDEKGKELMDDSTFKDIVAAVTPSKGAVEGVEDIKKYLTSGNISDTKSDVSPRVEELAEAASDSGDSDDDDDEDDGGEGFTTAPTSAQVAGKQPAEAPKSRQSSHGSRTGK